MFGIAGCVREGWRGAEGYERGRFRPADAAELARFLRDWGGRVATAAELLAAERRPDRVGTFVLRRRGAIIACLVVDEREVGAVRLAEVTGVVVHPDCGSHQLWTVLVNPLRRVFSRGEYGRLELGGVLDALDDESEPGREEG